ncbi:alpha/beta fold hydrolase [Plantactinospora sp. KBS50]|uniref:alpha/beta fold hydrolase n=1 Tax=Plantactinospora sp. KBS50 TaxID=2024580 RepID=UPI000BAB0A57|nr:alpha/beta hydrolase [Plantactinospora sp. KBS50]ASW54560.1 alpha/beta hydrolase [Plantactinospora sp. KBS50]
MTTFAGSDGTPLYYEDRDHDGVDSGVPPVVALAGGAALHPDYLGDLAGLGDRRRLVVPHLRGVGRSPLPDDVKRASFWRQAEDLDLLRAELGLDRLLVLGHSAGTRLAISYAIRFPGRVAGLVLVTPPVSYPPIGRLVDQPADTAALLLRRQGEPAMDAAVAAAAAGPETWDDAGFNAWQQRVAPLGYAAWGERERAHAAATHYSFAANRAYFSMPAPADLVARLGAVTAPVLVVAGGADCAAGVAPVAALARLFPAGRAEVIDGSGHFPWVERPAAFRRAVDGFLDALP